MDEVGDVDLFPRWRQAVRDFLAEFKYGDVVPHAWLEKHFGLPLQGKGAKLTVDQFRERQFEWLASIEAFKAELLEDHQVALQSVRGEGYRWVPPADQTGIAAKDLEKDVRRVFRHAVRQLRHVRIDELTDDQRRENSDTIAKLSQLRGASRKALR